MSIVTERVANSSLESLRQLARRVNKKETSVGRIPRQSRESNRFPLSFGQERFWFLDRLFPGSTAYNIPFALHFNTSGVSAVAPSLDAVVRLQQGILTNIVKRHEIWRTSFKLHNGVPVQVINSAETASLEVVVLVDVPEQTRMAEAARVILDRTNVPFDLSGPNQCRFGLIQLSATDYVSFIVCHHIVFDGMSLRVAMEEFRSGMLSALSGFQIPAAELTIQYADYAAWQREWWKQDEVRERLSRFWTEQLKELPVLNLPTDHPRPAVQSFRGRTEFFLAAKEHSSALRQMSKDHGVTLFATLLAVWAVLLQRYTGQTDLAVCVPSSNRTRAETEALLGFFVNTLVFRLDLSGDPTFGELQKRIWQTCSQAYAHQEMPFEQLVKLLQPTRDLSRNPLSSICFQLQDVPKGGAGEEPSGFGGGVSLQPFEVGVEASVFDLDFSLSGQWETQWVERAQDEIRGKMTYNADLFEADTVRRICEHYQNLLRSVVAYPHLRLSVLTMMSMAERQQLAAAWNTAPVNTPMPFVQELFETQVSRHPHAIALQFQDRQMSYGELNGRANRLARSLQQIGVGPESRVALCVERSCEMVVALLAVLKAGGAYVPLDPAAPADRLRFMVENSAPVVLLTQAHLRPLFPGIERTVSVLDLEEMTEPDGEDRDGNLDHNGIGLHSNHLAYVIYTSGSTGVPKGVEVRHGALSNLLTSMREAPGLSERDVLLAVTTISFDIAGLELFLPLIVGARVVLAGSKETADGVALADRIAQSGITVVQATPATWQLLIAAGWQGQNDLTVLCGGDALPRTLANDLLARAASVWNLFGPTETTIWSLVHKVSAGEGPVSIGRAIANTTLYVLDATLEPAPIGVPAELYIGGAGLARGYHGRPDLTAERFVPDPFATQPGMRLYKTGDLVRYRADGTIEFLGRNDMQVKVRGFRIELGEIESVLLRYPGMEYAAVVPWQRGDGDTRLLAYVQKKGDLDQARLREFLRQTLPEYMVPGRFIAMDRMPLNTNGKLDRKKLPPPSLLPAAEGERLTIARTPTQAALMMVWSRVLELSDVGLEDSFFDLGGHSLLALRLLDEMQRTFEVQLPLSALFASPTIAGLADQIDALLTGTTERAVETAPDFDLDAQLDPSIVPHSVVQIAPALSSVLLTGATGFVGAYLLAELLKQTDAKVYCLVRASSPSEALARVQQAMSRLGLWQPDLAHRIVTLCGDLSLKHFGLSAAEYEAIADKCEAIFHSGASVSFFYPYSMLKGPNVLGTEEVLRLACHHRQKRVHYVSTMGVFPQSSIFTPDGDFDPVMKEEDLPDWHGLNLGYTQSKWVAERLIAAASSRGIPASTYRPTMVYGDVETGQGNTQDFLYRFVQGCGELGYAPDIDWDLNLVPVDFVARAIVKLSLDPRADGRVFHLVNQFPSTMKDVVDCILTTGLGLTKISYDVWRKMLLVSPENALATLARGFPEEDPHVLGSGKIYADRQFRCDNVLHLLGADSSFHSPDVRGRMLQRYVHKILSGVHASRAS